MSLRAATCRGVAKGKDGSHETIAASGTNSSGLAEGTAL